MPGIAGYLCKKFISMKRIVILFAALALVYPALGQYVTPGTGVNWTMDDLVSNSGGVVTVDASNTYTIHEDLTVSADDLVAITAGTQINVADGVLITVVGTLNANPPENEIVFFKAENDHYLGFRFEDQTSSYLRNTYFKKAGGIKLVNASITFEDCDFTEFNQENSTGTIDVFQCAPTILNCSFTYNDGPAVMSGANASASPQVIGCEIMYNVQQNGNTPQINLGTSADSDSTRILNNTIIGDRDMEMAGGIAITTLFGGSINARIEGNVIKDNRYGITAYGNGVTAIIRNNEIIDNNTQNAPMLGGSGINFFGNETNHSIVTGNIISGNLWGITIQNAATPNLGQPDGGEYNPGMNQFYGNGNEGEIYDVYNNTPGDIPAENNYWGTMDPDTVEMHVFHQVDDPSLGLVDFLPLYNPPVGINELTVAGPSMEIYPNPALDKVYLHLETENGLKNTSLNVSVYSIGGQCILKSEIYLSENDQAIHLPASIAPGLYVLNVAGQGIHLSERFEVR